MKHSQYIDTLILRRLIPERHSIGVIKSCEIIENVICHQHRETELIYMERAYGTFLLGDNLISFDSEDVDQPGIIFLIGSLLSHSFFYHSNAVSNHCENSNVISVFFNTDTLGKGFFDLPEMCEIKQILEKPNCAYAVMEDARQIIAALMEELCESEGVSRITCFLKILELIAKPSNIEQVAGHSVVRGTTGNDLLTDIIRYVHEHYQTDLLVGETARMFNMSVSVFCSFVKRYTGRTFVEFVNRLRISKACERLLDSDDDITSIGYGCGFNNLSNFNRRFKQYKHESPREYRSRYKISG